MINVKLILSCQFLSYNVLQSLLCECSINLEKQCDQHSAVKKQKLKSTVEEKTDQATKSTSLAPANITNDGKHERDFCTVLKRLLTPRCLSSWVMLPSAPANITNNPRTFQVIHQVIQRELVQYVQKKIFWSRKFVMFPPLGTVVCSDHIASFLSCKSRKRGLRIR